MGKKDNEEIEVIDETRLVTGPAPEYKLQDTKVRIAKIKYEALTLIAKLFLLFSFGLVGLAVLAGFVNPEFSLKVLDLIWEKIASVYLVIFGSLLGKSLSR